MTSGLMHEHDGYRFATLLDEDGAPPCQEADGCSVCLLFDRQRPGESRAAWLARITKGVSA